MSIQFNIQRGTSVPANLSFAAILDDAQLHGFSAGHRSVVESVVTGLTKKRVDWEAELAILEETDEMIEHILFALSSVTGCKIPRQPYPEDVN